MKEIISQITEEKILEEYFHKENIDFLYETFKSQNLLSFEMIQDLTEENLKELGIDTLGERKKIIKLFDKTKLSNFKNSLLYSNLTENELEKLDLAENTILLKSNFQLINAKADPENGELILYLNRISWHGKLNNFQIPIIDVTDVSTKALLGESLIILKTIYQIFIFKKQNSPTTLAFTANGKMVGTSLYTDELSSEILLWKQRIEEQISNQNENPNTFSISHTPIVVKTTDKKRKKGFRIIAIICFIIIALFVGYFILLSKIFHF